MKKIPDLSIPCPYCKGKAKLMDSSVIYRGNSYGLAYICQPCEAYVGVHMGTTTPLGTPANKKTRTARNAAHSVFDPIWQHPSMRGSRKDAYRWLRQLLGIDADECHIGMMTEEEAWFIVREIRSIGHERARIEINRMRDILPTDSNCTQQY